MTQQLGLALTQILLSVGNNRGLTDWFSQLQANLTSSLDSAVQSAALQIAMWLLDVSENGLLPTIGGGKLTF
ncbi:hypothetical protein BpHYR1_007815 [Brachionus plicatilis]|uniref:Uncharacterized protein n=1 Tax=Brachionus plicatilis TaxID=10195 RepID=A0A3M7QIP6_BRAPC|nr:hypothetical protein BpHYR1_007815 [Brachionus plicatilis]